MTVTFRATCAATLVALVIFPLSVGRAQPPVYYLPRWTISGGPSLGVGVQSEARFRPKHTVLRDEGPWSWHANPFIGAGGYDGPTAERFIARIRERIAEGQALTP